MKLPSSPRIQTLAPAETPSRACHQCSQRAARGTGTANKTIKCGLTRTGSDCSTATERCRADAGGLSKHGVVNLTGRHPALLLNYQLTLYTQPPWFLALHLSTSAAILWRLNCRRHTRVAQLPQKFLVELSQLFGRESPTASKPHAVNYYVPFRALCTLVLETHLCNGGYVPLQGSKSAMFKSQPFLITEL